VSASRLNTNFNEHDFKRFLVLHVGDGHAKGESMRRYGGTPSTMGRPDKAFGRQERASRVASTRVTFVGCIPNLGLLHVFPDR
jgi:hypothetical protein